MKKNSDNLRGDFFDSHCRYAALTDFCSQKIQIGLHSFITALQYICLCLLCRRFVKFTGWSKKMAHFSSISIYL